MAFAVCALAGMSLAFAADEEACDEQLAEDAISQARAAVLSAPTERGDDGPCPFASADSPGYNVCYVANPRPSSTMPKWIARMQAQQAVDAVFSGVNDLYAADDTTNTPSMQPLWPMSPPKWVDDFVDQFERSGLPADPGTMCIEGNHDEYCQSLPSQAVMTTAGSLYPIDRRSGEVELPWSPEDDQQSQRPLVDLRVGPSIEHRRLPERPPCA